MDFLKMDQNTRKKNITFLIILLSLVVILFAIGYLKAAG